MSKDEAYNDNNNVIKSMYQVSVLGDFGLEWRVNAKRITNVAENLSKKV